ncbi:MAG: hypothetical protein ABIK54_04455 [candidate division WOR-3 bacterium]
MTPAGIGIECSTQKKLRIVKEQCGQVKPVRNHRTTIRRHYIRNNERCQAPAPATLLL